VRGEVGCGKLERSKRFWKKQFVNLINVGLSYFAVGLSVIGISFYKPDYSLQISGLWFILSGVVSLILSSTLEFMYGKLNKKQLVKFYNFYLSIFILLPWAIFTGAISRILGISTVVDSQLFVFIPLLVILSIMYILREDIASMIPREKILLKPTNKKILSLLVILALFSIYHLFLAIVNFTEFFLISEIHMIYTGIFAYLSIKNYKKYRLYKNGKKSIDYVWRSVYSDLAFLAMSFAIFDPFIAIFYSIT